MIHVNGKDYLFAKCTGYVHTSHVSYLPVSSLHVCAASLNGSGTYQSSTFIPAFLALSFSLSPVTNSSSLSSSHA